MNTLPGIIQDLQVHGNLTLVKVMISGATFTSVVIETPDTAEYLKVNTTIQVMFKETEVIIGKNSSDISLQNRLPSTVTEIKKGALLSQLRLQFEEHVIYSIITTNAVNQLSLVPGSEVIAMIKTNEIMLSE